MPDPRDVLEWKRVFDFHRDAQREAGLTVKHLFQKINNPNKFFLLLEAADVARMKALVSSSNVPDAQADSGVTDTPHIYFLNEIK